MAEFQPTERQLNLIKRMRDGSPEREETFQKFMKNLDKASLNDLSFREVPSLIHELRRLRLNPRETILICLQQGSR
jgi:hypothetical protein